MTLSSSPSPPPAFAKNTEFAVKVRNEIRNVPLWPLPFAVSVCPLVLGWRREQDTGTHLHQSVPFLCHPFCLVAVFAFLLLYEFIGNHSDAFTVTLAMSSSCPVHCGWIEGYSVFVVMARRSYIATFWSHIVLFSALVGGGGGLCRGGWIRRRGVHT